MGLQEVGKKKTREAAARTGLPIFRVMRHSNHLWFGWVREGQSHWHVEIDPATWDWEYDPGCGFSSCQSGEHGPSVIPDDAIVEEHQRRKAARQAERERKDAEFSAFGQMWRDMTQKQFDAQ